MGAFDEAALRRVLDVLDGDDPGAGGVRVWLATGQTDMRQGFDGLALLVQETLKRDPHCGHLFVFRGRRGDLIKVLWHDGQGMCLFAKRLERGRFMWPCRRTGGDDHAGAARLSAGRHRLAAAAADLAAGGGGLRLCDMTTCRAHVDCTASTPRAANRGRDAPPMLFPTTRDAEGDAAGRARATRRGHARAR